MNVMLMLRGEAHSSSRLVVPTTATSWGTGSNKRANILEDWANDDTVPTSVSKFSP